jgi:hypothetical protein
MRSPQSFVATGVTPVALNCFVLMRSSFAILLLKCREPVCQVHTASRMKLPTTSCQVAVEKGRQPVSP